MRRPRTIVGVWKNTVYLQGMVENKEMKSYSSEIWTPLTSQLGGPYQQTVIIERTHAK